MSNAISFHPMTGTDLDAVLKIEYAAFSHPRTRDILGEGPKNYCCWLMFGGSQQVGRSVVQIIPDETHLLNIAVEPESQGRGLGLHLLEHLMRKTAGHQARECFLEVRASNWAAYRPYEHYGFNEIGRRHGHYPAVGGREDILVIVCTLFD